jgi:hypothetical protein
MRMMMSDEIADVLADAREYIEKNGWWRGNLRGPNGKQVCSLGGLMFSQGLTEEKDGAKDPRVKAASRALIQAIYSRKVGGLSGAIVVNSLTQWNDRVAANKQDVLDTFAKAEKIERAGFDPDE